MKTAIVTGVTGQDGSYAAELLLAKGYRIVGTTRDISKGRVLLPAALRHGVQLVQWRQGIDRFERLIEEHEPHEIYNFAALSSGAKMYENPVEIGEVNGLAVTRVLEAMIHTKSAARLCQASSSEMFGNADRSPQDENTVLRPRSPYGAAKAYAHYLIDVFRTHYGVFCASAILYNHESPRRPLGFVSRKITHTAARISLGYSDELLLGDLGARRDWGFAGDYVEAMWRMMQVESPMDFVIASGVTHSVGDLCDMAFSHFGLDYRMYVREDPDMLRRAEAAPLVGDASKARQILSWTPQVSMKRLITEMCEADLAALSARKSA